LGLNDLAFNRLLLVSERVAETETIVPEKLDIPLSSICDAFPPGSWLSPESSGWKGLGGPFPNQRLFLTALGRLGSEGIKPK